MKGTRTSLDKSGRTLASPDSRYDGSMTARGADVVVVGGGIAGASTAFALALGGASVTVIDAARRGSATAAGAGIIAPWSSPDAGDLYELSSLGAAHYATLMEQLADVDAGATGYRRSGALVVNGDVAVVDEVERRVRARAASTPTIGKIERVDSAEARELFPPLAEGLDGLFIEGGARVDGRLLCQALLDGAVRLGANIVEGSATLQRAREGMNVIVDGLPVGADSIVIAGGAWTRELLSNVSISIGLAPQRGQIIHLRMDRVETSRWPSVLPMSGHYMLAFDDSRVVVGATRETGSGFDPRVTAAGQHHVLTKALGLAPKLADATVIETRVGLRPMPDKGLPFIGPIADHDRVFVATGFGANGLTIAPYVGQLLAELILTDRSLVALTPFEIGRSPATCS